MVLDRAWCSAALSTASFSPRVFLSSVSSGPGLCLGGIWAAAASVAVTATGYDDQDEND